MCYYRTDLIFKRSIRSSNLKEQSRTYDFQVAAGNSHSVNCLVDSLYIIQTNWNQLYPNIVKSLKEI